MLTGGGMRLAVGAALVVAVAAASGCGTGLSESSSCKDFMNASPQDQQAITSKLAGKYQKPTYATPLGAPAVPYYCSSHPDTTLGQFFSVAGS